MDTPDPRIADGISAVMAAAGALPRRDDLQREISYIAAASARGYFLPDEDETVRLRYMQYLAVRTALLETVESLAAAAGNPSRDWSVRLPAFVTAFAAACLLLRAGRFVTDLALAHPVLWMKLDEDDLRLGLPRKSFTRFYKAFVSPAALSRFHAASEFYHGQRAEIAALAADPVLLPVVALLAEEEEWIEPRRRDGLKRHLAYRVFSFRRRHRSAWKKVMFGMFEVAGTAIAELRQPGVKPSGAPKRLTPDLREELMAVMRPGDVCVTRHDDALSNLFLPGFWPHAVLHLGTSGERTALGVAAVRQGGGDPCRFLEAKKDGVRFRLAEETLAVDACLVLRSPLESGDLARAIGRAMEHEGKLYDFLFDFRNTGRLACTGVIYQGFHGIGPVAFRLKEVSGRLCLPAEDLLDQALECGFHVVASCGIGEKPLLLAGAAEAAFRASRRSL